MKKRFRWWWRQFLSSSNRHVHSGIVFAGVGALLGFAAFVFYAFYLQKDIGANLVALLSLLTGLGGAAGSLAGKFLPGPPSGWTPPPAPKPKGD